MKQHVTRPRVLSLLAGALVLVGTMVILTVTDSGLADAATSREGAVVSSERGNPNHEGGNDSSNNWWRGRTPTPSTPTKTPSPTATKTATPKATNTPTATPVKTPTVVVTATATAASNVTQCQQEFRYRSSANSSEMRTVWRTVDCKTGVLLIPVR